MTAPDPRDHAALLHPSEYLRWQDLLGKPVAVTIESAAKEELQCTDGSKEAAPVLAFSGKKKRLVLGKTSRKVIQHHHGDWVSLWIGKTITLVPDPGVKFGRDDVGGIRIAHPWTGAKTCRLCSRNDTGYRDSNAPVHRVTKGVEVPQ